MTQHILSLDQGTSSSRAIIYTAAGDVVSHAQQPFDMTFPNDGWVEQDPEVLWRTTYEVATEAIREAGLSTADIAAIGITNQRETTLVWDKNTGECIYNAIVWQDRRTADRCEVMAGDQIEGVSLAEYISAHTGLLIDPYFSGTKLAWILDHVPGVRERAKNGELAFGTVDTFLIWRLTEGRCHYTDASNASRTELYDIHAQCWNEPLLEYFDIPIEMLPEVKDNAGDLGEATALGGPIPITGAAGDQQAALIGQACFSPGQVKSTYGTGCFVISNTGQEAISSTQNLLTTIAYQLNGEVTYGLEGSIFVAGVAIKWLRDQLNLIDDVTETSSAFRETGGDTNGVYVVPAFTGLGAPHWRPNVRGMISGLTLDSSRAQVITAFLQSVCFQTQELLSAMSHDGAKITEIRVDGGMVVNDDLCQFLADILGIKVVRPKDVETTARGAAILAALGAGIFTDLDSVSSLWGVDREFSVQMDAEKRTTLLDGYAKAVRLASAE